MGERVGPYEIVRRIAEGGMAEVLLARFHGEHGIERRVVLKRLRRDAGTDDEERVEMFLDEARIMAALSHPNIARVLDVLHEGDEWYIAMEHVDGPSLRELLDVAGATKQRLPRPVALGIALAICEALAYAHGREDDLGKKLGLVHRDLTPANVVVAYDGAVSLVDFGIAKAATKVHETRTGLVRGTPGYMAPEQMRGEHVDLRADVFAMGVVLFELCLGVRPFEKIDIASGTLPPHRRPLEIDPSLPRDLAALIEDCLAPSPETRPASIGVVRDAIAAHLARGGTWPTMARIALVVHDLVPGDPHHATVVAPPSVSLRRAPAKRRPARSAGGNRTIVFVALVFAAIALAAFILGRALGAQ